MSNRNFAKKVWLMIKQIVLASKNKGKVSEIAEILKAINIKVVSMEDVGFDEDIKETGSTFEENALIKAKTIYNKLRCPVLADDSGLEVEYLANAPGVFSARFAENDDKRIQKLLYLLDGVSESKRKARFVCSMVLVINDDEVIITKGTVEGYIAKERQGDNGFGYDPIFYVPQYKKTMAQLETEIKNQISHRAKALQNLVEQLEKYNM